MTGKIKAILLGAVIGAVVALVVELLAVLVNGDAFFGSERSWLILVVAVFAFGWAQFRAHERKHDPRQQRDRR